MAVITNGHREIQPFDIVDIMTDPPSVMEVSWTVGSGVDQQIYVRDYLIKPVIPVLLIEFNTSLNKWVVSHSDSIIDVIFRPRPDFPESAEALEYLRGFVSSDISRPNVEISDDRMVYDNHDDGLIESAMTYWQRMISNDGLNIY